MEEKRKAMMLRAKRDRRKVLKDIKEIFIDTLSIEVNDKVHIIDQLIDTVHKFNEDIDGQDKLLMKVERKFENKVLENVALKIPIDQVEISTLIYALEITVNNVVSLFVKLSDSTNFTKEIKEKLVKVDMDLKDSANHLAINPSSKSIHLEKPRFLTDLYEEMLREEARIRETFIDIQGMIFPHMDINGSCKDIGQRHKFVSCK